MPQLAPWLGELILSIALPADIAALGAGVEIVAGVTVAEAVGTAALVGITVGLQDAFSPSFNLPTPANVKTSKRQAVASRMGGGGRARISGYYMCYEEKEGVSYDVFALLNGEIDGIEAYYLHDDLVTLSGDTVQPLADGSYGDSKIKILTRSGLSTETAYSEVVAGLPGIWTTDHRGDGIASLALICDKVEPSAFSKIYPQRLPEPSVVARLQRFFDPRDGAQDPDDPSTWTWNPNPVLGYLDYLRFREGKDYATRILPEIDYWIDAADVCDEDVNLAAGGTEKRYEWGGVYSYDNDPADVGNMFLSTFDGWISETGTGALRLFAGKFSAPTKTISARHITGYSVQRFTGKEDAVNEIAFTYTSPDHKYQTIDGQRWRDEANISARGETISRQIEFPWVQSHSRCRRLVKRRMMRANAPARGSIQTDLYGLCCLGERYLTIELPDFETLASFTAEIQRVTIDIMKGTLVFEWLAMDATIDDWNEAEEEGSAPADPDIIEPEPPTTPDPPEGTSEGVSD